MPIFSSLARIKVHQEHNHTWRTLMVPDLSFGGFSHICHHMSLLGYMPYFSSLALLKVYQDHSHTWMTLMVPDWNFGGLSPLWY